MPTGRRDGSTQDEETNMARKKGRGDVHGASDADDGVLQKVSRCLLRRVSCEHMLTESR